MGLHDIRFVEDDWESPTLGAWGLGWEVWCDGMEVSQFTYFQQVGGHDCAPVSGELTYGLERLAMYVLGIDHVMDMPFNDPGAPIPLTYGDVFRQTEREYSRWNFDVADTAMLFDHFEEAEAECAAHPRRAGDGSRRDGASSWRSRPMTSASRPATSSTCSTRAASSRRPSGRPIIARVRALAKRLRRRLAGDRRRRRSDGRRVTSRITGRAVLVGMGIALLVFAAALWWFQTRAWYARGDGRRHGRGRRAARCRSADWRGIDAASSPIKLRACFRVEPGALADAPIAEAPTPLVAPGWFDCFDARRLAAALAEGEARAVRAAAGEFADTERLIAVYPDGRAYMWRQLTPDAR